jgi:hypothetical protein
VFPIWGMLIQLAALVLFDVGCATHLIAGGSGSSKQRGPGYWCAFTAAMLRAVIALMHILQAKPTQVCMNNNPIHRGVYVIPSFYFLPF